MNFTDFFSVKTQYGSFNGEAVSVDEGFKCGNLLFTVNEKKEDDIYIRKDTVKNTGNEPITLYEVLSRFKFNGGEYEVYSQYSQWCMESVGKWDELNSGIFYRNHEIRNNVGSNPFFALYNLQNQRGKAFHIIADGLWQYAIYRDFIQGPHHRIVVVEAGYDNFAYELQPGETLELPVILYYDFKNKIDLDAYKLHNFVNKRRNARLPVIYNTWMGVFDNISTDILMPQLEKAKYIGCEYFVIDAGWFGEKYKWFNTVGDWKEAENCQMCGKMKDFADTVRKNGLKFGLWFEIERASLSSETVKNHPEYYIIENGQAFVNFANKEARDYIFGVVCENIRKYNIEFIKFDFNASLTNDKTNRAFIDYFKGYREFIKNIRREFPDIYLENCASGGMRMSLSSLRDFDSFWISDNHSVNAQIEIFKNTLLRLPATCMEKWVTVGSLDGLFNDRKTIVASGDAGWGFTEGVKDSTLKEFMKGGPIGISCDLTKIVPEHLELLKEQILKHKEERDFWQKEKTYILSDTEHLICLEYSTEDETKLSLFVKREIQNCYTAYPHCEGKYKLEDNVYTNLNESGIDINLIFGDYVGQSIELNKIKE